MCALWEFLEFDMIVLLGYSVAVLAVYQLGSSDSSEPFSSSPPSKCDDDSKMTS